MRRVLALTAISVPQRGFPLPWKKGGRKGLYFGGKSSADARGSLGAVGTHAVGALSVVHRARREGRITEESYTTVVTSRAKEDYFRSLKV